MNHEFTGVIGRIKSVAHAIKSGFLKTVHELDTVVLPEAEKLKLPIEAVSEAILPGSSRLEEIGNAWLEDTVNALDKGGSAVESNLTSSGLDIEAINALKALIPQFRVAATIIKAPAPKAG